MKRYIYVFITFCVIVVGYMLYSKWNYIFPNYNNQVAIDADAVRISEMQAAEHNKIRFAGQYTHIQGSSYTDKKDIILLKGKLIDQNYKELYDLVEDSIHLNFGATLYYVGDISVENLSPQTTFVLHANYGLDRLGYHKDAYKFGVSEHYARLVYEGKAEGYRIDPSQYSSPKYLLSPAHFENKYGEYFDNGYTRMNEFDYEIKEALLEFFNTDEGNKYGYPSDQRDYRQLINYGDYSQVNKQGLAIVLCNKEMEKIGKVEEVLLVVTYDPLRKKYAIIYKKFFLDRIIINYCYYYPDSDKYATTYDDEYRSIQTVLLQVIDEPIKVLKYNREFDKMDEIYPVEVQEGQYISEH